MSAHALRPLLLPLGKAYAQIMRLRERLYSAAILPSWTPWRPPAPCVSVGNIAMGGTGKTPLTAWILRHATEAGYTPACLTRGYRAKPPHLPFLVHPDSDPAQCGDEPLLLARSCARAHILVDPKRSRAGKYAAEHLHPDLFVLDDGFQHMAVARDLNLVLLRPEDLDRDWNRVCPAGYWREPVSALRRANAFCIKAAPDELRSLNKWVSHRLQPLNKPVFGFHLTGRDLINISTQQTQPTLNNAPYIFAAGIAHPEQAASTAKELLGNMPKKVVSFRDHADFTANDLERLVQTARNAHAAHIVVTEKDAVKLQGMALPPSSSLPEPPDTPDVPSIWALRTQIGFQGGFFTQLKFSEFFTTWLHTATKEQIQ